MTTVPNYSEAQHLLGSAGLLGLPCIREGMEGQSNTQLLKGCLAEMTVGRGIYWTGIPACLQGRLTLRESIWVGGKTPKGLGEGVERHKVKSIEIIGVHEVISP